MGNDSFIVGRFVPLLRRLMRESSAPAMSVHAEGLAGRGEEGEEGQELANR